MGALANLKERIKSNKVYKLVAEAFGSLSGMVTSVPEEEVEVGGEVTAAIEKLYGNVIERTGMEKDKDGYNEIPNKLEGIEAEVSEVQAQVRNDRAKGGKERIKGDE